METALLLKFPECLHGEYKSKQVETAFFNSLIPYSCRFQAIFLVFMHSSKFGNSLWSILSTENLYESRLNCIENSRYWVISITPSLTAKAERTRQV